MKHSAIVFDTTAGIVLFNTAINFL